MVDEIVSVVVFLVGSEVLYVMGMDIFVDGGMIVGNMGVMMLVVRK